MSKTTLRRSRTNTTLKNNYKSIKPTKRLAYYTCYFGGDTNYSKMIPPVPSQTDDCYFFTNNQDIFTLLKSTRFIPIFMSYIRIENDSINDAMNSKILRACPFYFRLLNNYQYLCWFDTKLTVFEDKVQDILAVLEKSPKLMAFTKHSLSDTFKSVWDEYNLAITYERYSKQKDMYKNYIETQLSKGFSEKIEIHFCTGFNIRKNCRKVKEIGEKWLEHICECGIECQISFQFINQLYGQYILPLEYQATWKYSYE